MKIKYICVGSSPLEENYSLDQMISNLEARVFAEQLERMYPEFQARKVSFVVRSTPDNAGYETFIKYDLDIPTSLSYAVLVEAGLPYHWDGKAIEDLKACPSCRGKELICKTCKGTGHG